MDFKTLDDRVVVKKEEFTTQPESVIIITTPVEITVVGEVVSVGEGKHLPSGIVLPMSVNVGERIMFLKNTGIDVKIDGVEYVVLHEHEILGVVE